MQDRIAKLTSKVSVEFTGREINYVYEKRYVEIYERLY